MNTHERLIAFAAKVRADRAANPASAGDGTALELLVAPTFQALVADVLPSLTAAPLRVLPEFRRPGVGRPDLALKAEGAPARAFIELKAPGKAIEPALLQGHDADQFRRFSELPLWALTNASSLRLQARGEMIDSATIVPSEALDPVVSAATAERLIRAVDPAGFERILTLLAQAQPPQAANAVEVAQVLAHAARLVRAVVEAQCDAGLDPVVDRIRADFNETLFARAEAGGYDVANANALFASAFAQTLLFGLLLAREAAGGARDIDANAYQLLPEGTYPLLRGTLRALTMDETRAMLGAAFDTAIDAVNAIDTGLLAPEEEGRDPVLYLYEDFLRTYDPEAVKKYGVYYTPPEVVRLIVAEADRALREGLGVDGLMNGAVQLLDPACGTGTFLIAATGAVARAARERYGEGAVAAEVSDFARRMHGFELLVGPYTVAHYRMLREVKSHGGAAEALPIHLTDTLAPPAGATGVEAHLDFLSAPMVAERERADAVKSTAGILCILGNPPYKRLKKAERVRLVGPDMLRRWRDLTQPVTDAGHGRSLNAFPDLYIAFYRWSLWRLFDVKGAPQRGVLAFITNRGFLTGRGFGGLRRMLRRRFDHIRIIDLRGDSRGARPADILRDDNVFNIQVGVCILVAWRSGEPRPDRAEAEVEYADIWRAEAFTRHEKLDLCAAAADTPQRFEFKPVEGADMDPLKPIGFAGTDWPGVNELFAFASNGVVTYRDAFVYATGEQALRTRVQTWHALPVAQAQSAFVDSDLNDTVSAQATEYDPEKVRQAAYRPLDGRWLYAHSKFVDRLRPELVAKWGSNNVALFAPSDGVGAGPAAWAHSTLPDQHAFRGSYGGWVFPLRSHAGEGPGHLLAPGLLAGLARAYGECVSAQETFDAMLALLSATSYAFRFGRDMEDDFPHVPFPAQLDVFHRAAALGERLRALEGLADPAPAFRVARFAGQASAPVLDVPAPAAAWKLDPLPKGVFGPKSKSVRLRADASLRLTGVSERAWNFAVSGYTVLHHWLVARNGEAIDRALQRAILDTAGRIEEIVSLCDRADAVLAEALADTLGRADLGLPPRRAAPVLDEEGVNEPA